MDLWDFMTEISLAGLQKLRSSDMNTVLRGK